MGASSEADQSRLCPAVHPPPRSLSARDLECTLEACRGYHFAPTHAIQDNTPVENVLAMYQAAHNFGTY